MKCLTLSVISLQYHIMKIAPMNQLTNCKLKSFLALVLGLATIPAIRGQRSPFSPTYIWGGLDLSRRRATT